MAKISFLVFKTILLFLAWQQVLADPVYTPIECLQSETGRLDFSLCDATPSELYSVGFDNVKDISAFDDFTWGVSLLKAAADQDHVLANALLHALGRNYAVLFSSRSESKYEEVDINPFKYYFKLSSLSGQLDAEAKLIIGLSDSLLSVDIEGVKTDVDINDWLSGRSEPYLEAGKWLLRSIDSSTIDGRHSISLLHVYKSELLGLQIAGSYRQQLESMLLKLKGPAFVRYYKSMAEH